MPNNFHCIAPRPSTKLSRPRMGTPRILTVARHTIPCPQEITSSAENEYQVFSLISPCMRRRTADASGAPSMIACWRYRSAPSGRGASESKSISRSVLLTEFHIDSRSLIATSFLREPGNQMVLTPSCSSVSRGCFGCAR
jgi:hypothetical protein